jgi:hypothetical protein
MELSLLIDPRARIPVRRVATGLPGAVGVAV